MKTVSRGLALEVSARVATQVDWDQIDAEKLHADVASLSPEEFGRRFTLFLKAGARFIFGGLKVACVPFNPVEFLGEGWSFWKGPATGNGLEGEEVRDKAAMVLIEVDFEKTDFLTCLEKGESSIKGEEKSVRLHKLNRTLYGANQFMGFWQDYQQCQDKTQSKLERFYQQTGIIYVDFFGDPLRNPDGDRGVLYLYRLDGGLWYWNGHWLGSGWRGRDFTAVSQQVFS